MESVFQLVDRIGGYINETDSDALAETIDISNISTQDTLRIESALSSDSNENPLFWGLLKRIIMSDSLIAQPGLWDQCIPYHINESPDKLFNRFADIFSSAFVKQSTLRKVILSVLTNHLEKFDLYSKFEISKRIIELVARTQDQPIIVKAADKLIESCSDCSRKLDQEISKLLLSLIIQLDESEQIRLIGNIKSESIKLAAIAGLCIHSKVGSFGPELMDRNSLFRLGSCEMKNTRKQARFLLESSMSLSNWWEPFWAIQDCLDDYASHLFKDILPEFFTLVADNSELCREAAEAVLSRAYTHQNKSVVRFSLNMTMQNSECSALFSDHFILTNLLPTLWSNPSIYSGEGWEKVTQFILRILEAREDSTLLRRIFLFQISQSTAHFGPHMAILSALLTSSVDRDIPLWDDELYKCFSNFVVKLSFGYPAALRLSVVSAATQIVSTFVLSTLKSPLHHSSVKQLCCMAAQLPVFGDCSLSENVLHLLFAKDPVDTYYSIHTELLQAVLQNQLEISDALVIASGLNRLIVEYYRSTKLDCASLLELSASWVLAFNDRLYASNDELRLKSHNLACISNRILNKSNIEMVTEAVESVLIPHILSLLLKKDFDKLFAFTPIIISLMEKVSLPHTSKLFLEAIDSQETRFFALQLLSSFKGLADFDVWSTVYPLSLSYTYFIPNIGSLNQLGETAITGSLIPISTKDELMTAFQVAKWKMLAASEQVNRVSHSDLIDALSAAGNSEVPFICECLKAPGGLDHLTELQEVERLCNIFTAILKRRSHIPISEDTLIGMMSVVSHPSCLKRAPIVVSHCVKFIMTIGAATSGYAFNCIKVLLVNMNEVEHKETVIDLLTDIICYREAEPENEKHDSYNSALARLHTIFFLESLPVLAGAVIQKLLNVMDSRHKELKMRKVPDTPMPLSDNHRFQLRAWQAICVLARHVDKQIFEDICPMLFGHLSRANQPDVKDYEELAISFWAARYWEVCRDYLIEALSDVNNPVQCIASVLVVSSYIIKSCSKEEISPEISELIQAMIPHCLSNSAFIRAQSHHLLWTERDFIKSVLKDNCTITALIDYLSNQKEAVAMRNKQEPIYSRFNPESLGHKCMSFDDVYRLLTSLGSGASFKDGEIRPDYPIMQTLRDSVQEEMTERWYGDAVDHPLQSSVLTRPISSTMNFQRKYDPVGKDLEAALFPSTLTQKRNQTDLILIATFVDKTTNIAGLCRTAEVFGAHSLVVSNLGVMKDPQFKNMTVTAHEWIDMVEVDETDLLEYLNKLKKEEYTLVGLEQTSTSKSLGDVHWCKKTAIVLGAEKEGIPIWAVQALDYCIEIPQLGMVRSLNVHVSGALAMWEYNRFTGAF